MFYGVLALLGTEKRETSKHQAAIAIFDREFVKAGIFTKDLSKWLHEALNLRLSSDYVPLFRPTQEHAEEILHHAKLFVSAVKSHLAEFLASPEDADNQPPNR